MQMDVHTHREWELRLILRVELIAGRRQEIFLATCVCKGSEPCITVFQAGATGERDGKK